MAIRRSTFDASHHYEALVARPAREAHVAGAVRKKSAAEHSV